jgi:hypothetical protein
MHNSFILFYIYIYIYITILDTFPAILCSSSGGLNCIFTASGIVTLCKRPYSAPVESGLQPLTERVTIPDAVTIQFRPPEDEHSIARNMSRIVMYYIYYRIKGLCIKFVIETSQFRSLSYVRFIASPKASSPVSAI